MINSKINNPVKINKKNLYITVVVVLAICLITSLCKTFIDVEGTFINDIIPPVVALILSVFAIYIAKKYIKSDFGFTLVNKGPAKLYWLMFVIVWIIYTVFLAIIINDGSASQNIFESNINIGVILQAVMALILSGIAEEVLFRSFAMTTLDSAFISESKNEYEFLGKNYKYNYLTSTAVSVSSVLFALFSIKMVLYPIVININIGQILVLLVMGYTYGYTFYVTKNIFNSMIMNCLIKISPYIAFGFVSLFLR